MKIRVRPSVCFGVLGILILAATTTLGIFVIRPLIDTINNPPEPVVILSIPDFEGRVLPYWQVNPGTFTIRRPFDEALGWGKDSIMAFGFRTVRIWRPDPETSSVFQYSAKSFPRNPWDDGKVFEVGEVRFDTQTREFIGYPKVTDRFSSGLAIVSIIGVVGLILGVVFLVISYLERPGRGLV